MFRQQELEGLLGGYCGNNPCNSRRDTEHFATVLCPICYSLKHAFKAASARGPKNSDVALILNRARKHVGCRGPNRVFVQQISGPKVVQSINYYVGAL